MAIGAAAAAVVVVVEAVEEAVEIEVAGAG
jgi:hypothetical protein